MFSSHVKYKNSFWVTIFCSKMQRVHGNLMEFDKIKNMFFFVITLVYHLMKFANFDFMIKKNLNYTKGVSSLRSVINWSLSYFGHT